MNLRWLVLYARRRARRANWRWLVLYAWIAVFTVATIDGQIQNRQRITENRRLIDAVHSERVRSCRQTYSAIQQTLIILSPALLHVRDPYADINERLNYLLRLFDARECG